MSVTEHLAAILAELTHNQGLVDEDQLQQLADDLLAAHHVFLAGAGRSGIALNAFANRLLHLGLSVSVVGETTSPHSAAGDLLLIGSGSGETGSLVSLAQKAVAAGVRVALVTMDPSSTIARAAQTVVVLPGVSPKVSGASSVTSIQPMGSAFEQLSLLTYDALVLELMSRTNQDSDAMFTRHADLE